MKAPHRNNGAESPDPKKIANWIWTKLKKIANWGGTKLKRPAPIWTIPLFLVIGGLVGGLVWRSVSPTGRDHTGDRWTSAVLPESIKSDESEKSNEPFGEQLSKKIKEESANSEEYFIKLLNRKATDISVDRSAPDNASYWLEPRVAVYSVPAVNTPHRRPTLRDLDESGQAHAIDTLAQAHALDSVATDPTKNPKAEPDLWSELQTAMSDASELSGEKNPFQFERLLVATVTKGMDWLPGDRMLWTRVFVLPINFSFAGYTVARTENTILPITSVEATTTKKSSAGIDLAIPGLEGSKAEIGSSGEHTIKSTADITTQYEKLGIDITSNFLRIIREGGTNEDAVGNTIVSLSVTTDPIAIYTRQPGVTPMTKSTGDDVVLLVTGTKNLEEEANEYDGTKLRSIQVSPQGPVPHCPLKAEVWMLYEERQIVGDDHKYYDESRQKVILRPGADPPKSAEIVSADDVSPAIWSIQILNLPTEAREINLSQPKGNQKITPETIYLLGAHVDENSKYRELVFTDQRRASEVARWIRTHPPGTQLQNNLTFNYPAGKSLVPVKKTEDECGLDYEPTSRVVYLPLPSSISP